MNTRTIVSGIVIASLGFSSLAFAQPSRNGPPHGSHAPHAQQRGPQHAAPHRAGPPPHARHAPPRKGHHAAPNHAHPRHHYNARSPEFRRGGRLPHELRTRQYVVNDWRGHRLSAPPRGHQWVQVGPDYVLTAIATGVIAALILNQ